MAGYSLISSTTAYIEVIDKVFERIPPWIFPFLYWPAFGFVGLLFVISNGPLMLLVSQPRRSSLSMYAGGDWRACPTSFTLRHSCQ
jgi:hypothetical protein